MFEKLPPQFWIIAILAIVALIPAAYVFRHLAHSRTPRDITLPAEDLHWKSDRKLYLCLAILTVIVGLGFFVLSPEAKEFAESAWFIPATLGVLGSVALGTLASGWRNGEIEPLIRGFSQTYTKAEHPKRYWASMVWNGVVGCSMMAGSLGVMYAGPTQRCDGSSEDREVLLESLEACGLKIAKADNDATLFADRAHIYHKLSFYEQALNDYTRAIELDPEDSYSLHNRAIIFQGTGQARQAITDLDASLALRPNNDAAYLERGFAHASVGDRDRAELDFNRFSVGDGEWSDVLRGRAVLALGNEKYPEAIEYLEQALAIAPDDTLSRQMRADTYWEIGERDLARDDYDKLMGFEPSVIPSVQ